MFGTLQREIGQTLVLLGLLAAVTGAYVAIGLAAIHLLG